MKTIESLAEVILRPYGLETDMIEVEIVKQRILSYRQELIRQDYNRTLIINEQLVQAFNVELIKVEEDDDVFYISDHLPKPMLLKKSPSFLNVHTTVQGRYKKPLGYLSPAQVPYISVRSFTKESDYYTYENDKIIVFSESPSVRIRGIWDNPIAAYEFASNEIIKLSCSEDTISSPCYDGTDLYLEETLAARILTFFNPRTNGSDSTHRQTENTNTEN